MAAKKVTVTFGRRRRSRRRGVLRGGKDKREKRWRRKKVTVTFGRRRRSRRRGVQRRRREKKVTKKVTKKGDSHRLRSGGEGWRKKR